VNLGDESVTPKWMTNTFPNAKNQGYYTNKSASSDAEVIKLILK